MLDDYTIEILSVNQPPIGIKMVDSINCPICDNDLLEMNEIDINTFKVDNDTTLYCEGCDLKIRLKVRLI